MITLTIQFNPTQQVQLTEGLMQMLSDQTARIDNRFEFQVDDAEEQDMLLQEIDTEINCKYEVISSKDECSHN